MERRRSVWLAMVSVLIPILGPVAALLIMRRQGSGWVVLNKVAIAALLVQLMVISAGGGWFLRQRRQHDQIAMNVYLVQNAIDRWATAHAIFAEVPDNLNELLKAGYLDKLPINPYSGQPVKEVPPHQVGRPGDITYLPVYNLAPDEYKYPSGYGLYGYGPDKYIGRFENNHVLPGHIVFSVDMGLDLLAVKNKNGEVTCHCRGGLTCAEVLRLYKGDKVDNWVTAAEYHRLKAKKGADSTP